MVQWGDPIPVDGQRPAWLADDDVIQWSKSAERLWLPRRGINASVYDQSDYDENIKFIRLPVDHWAYPAILKGFTPWAGGEAAPDDWDEGEVLLRDRQSLPAYCINRWRHLDTSDDVIGYRKRTEAAADPLETLKQAAPASFRGPVSIGAALKPFKWGDPIKPVPQPSITPEFIALVVTERDGLRKRVTDLLNANNGLVQERRDLAAELESMRGTFERSQDDLATLRAEADERWQAMMSPPPTQAVPDHLTITITGPQGCGKTRFANGLKTLMLNIGASSVDGAKDEGLAGSPRFLMEPAIKGKRVTIIDTQTPPAVSDVVAEEAPEYVFGPWLSAKQFEKIQAVGTSFRWRRQPDLEPKPGIHTRKRLPRNLPIAHEYSRAYRIGEWHPHHPGEMPVTGDTQVQVCTRTGDIQPAARADEFEWEDVTTCVVAFRPVAVVAEVDVYFVPRAEAAE